MKKLAIILTVLLVTFTLLSCGQADGGKLTSRSGEQSTLAQALESAVPESTPTPEPTPERSEAPGPGQQADEDETSSDWPSDSHESQSASEAPTQSQENTYSFDQNGYTWTFVVIPEARTGEFVDMENRSDLELEAHPQPEGTRAMVLEFISCTQNGSDVNMDSAYTEFYVKNVTFTIDGASYTTPLTSRTISADGTTYYIYIFVPEGTSDDAVITAKSA